jgi:mannose-6-phosphate isomerase-like protein (cupin superfamily)
MLEGFMTYRLIPGLLALSVACGVHADDAKKEQSIALAFKDARVQWGPCPDFMPKGCQLAVLHGDPAQKNADVFLKVPGDSTLPHHWHTSAERMILVSGELQVTYDGQAPVTLKPGMYAYGPPKLGHKAECAKGEPCVLFIAFESPVDAVPSAAKVK